MITGYLAYSYYPFIFSKKITGKIARVERVNAPTSTVISRAADIPKEQLFSFAIAIETKDGEVHTASSEDRQWAVANVGQCVIARYFPYPPWELNQAGTFFNARLLELRNCP